MCSNTAITSTLTSKQQRSYRLLHIFSSIHTGRNRLGDPVIHVRSRREPSELLLLLAGEGLGAARHALLGGETHRAEVRRAHAHGALVAPFALGGNGLLVCFWDL